MSVTNIIKQEMSETPQAGYLCGVCGVTNIVYTLTAPLACLNCGDSTKLDLKWSHLLRTVTTAESLP